MNKSDRHDRVTRLTSAWLDGIATAEEKAELAELLNGDPESCEVYLDLIDTHARIALQTEGQVDAISIAEQLSLPRPETNSPIKKKYSFTAISLVAGLAVLLLLALNIFDYSPSEPMSDGGGIAVVSRLVDTDSKFSEGDILRPGEFIIEKGFAQLEFFCGSTVIVEAPAHLDIKSMWLAKCLHGRLRVSVPEPARGFSIQTVDYEAVDLGTEFAISVSPQGASEVHVLDGEVRVDDLSGKEITLLKGGSAIKSDGKADIETLSEEGSNFVSRKELQALATDTWGSAYNIWKQKSLEHRKNPDILRYFDFENQDPWDRQLANRSTIDSNAAIIGSEWVEGRWPGKGALEFGRVSDRVRLQIPGKYEELTLAASIRIRSLDRWLSSLILTDGFEKGAVHWQISDEGKLIMGIGGSSPGTNTTSPTVVEPKNLGRWIHVAVTIDRKSRTVIHYLNGKEVARGTKNEIPPLRFGNAEIGNWQAKEKSYPIRSFNGQIDEFIIFQKALSAEEIAQLSSK